MDLSWFWIDLGLRAKTLMAVEIAAMSKGQRCVRLVLPLHTPKGWKGAKKQSRFSNSFVGVFRAPLPLFEKVRNVARPNSLCT